MYVVIASCGVLFGSLGSRHATINDVPWCLCLVPVVATKDEGQKFS
jgi:hypothetical protein